MCIYRDKCVRVLYTVYYVSGKKKKECTNFMNARIKIHIG